MTRWYIKLPQSTLSNPRRAFVCIYINRSCDVLCGRGLCAGLTTRVNVVLSALGFTQIVHYACF